MEEKKGGPAALAGRTGTGVVLVLLSATGFAAKGILAKMAYQEGVDPSTVLDLRMLSVLPVYLAGVAWFGRMRPESRPGPGRADFWKIVLLGLLGFDFSAWLDFEGLSLIGAGLERLVLFLYPTFVVFLSALLGRRRVGLREILSSLLAWAGLFVVTAGNPPGAAGEREGVLLVIGSGLFYALYLVGVERVVRRVDPLYLTSLVMVAATLALLLQSLATGHFRPATVHRHALFLIAAMGVFSTAIPTFFMTMGIAAIGASRAALLSFFGPVITLLMAGMLLGERMTFRDSVGALLILVGVGLVALGGKREEIRKNG